MLAKPQAQHIKDGNAAEDAAADFLQQKGLKLIARNFRCPYGEIDLIMQDGKTLVFVEVRLRSSSDFGGAAMSITQSKQQKLKRSAERYMQLHGECACRFDAILMQSINTGAIEWVHNAF